LRSCEYSSRDYGKGAFSKKTGTAGTNWNKRINLECGEDKKKPERVNLRP